MAIDYTWTGATNNDWGEPNNWNPNTSAAGIGPTVGDTARFDSDANVTLGAARTIVTLYANTANITFNDAFNLNVGAIRAESSTTITNTGSLITNDATLYDDNGAGISVNISNWQQSGTTTLSSAGTLTFGSAIAGSGDLRIDGGGTIILSGSSTYTGSTTVSSGILQTSAADLLPNTTTLNIASGAECTLDDQDLAGISGSGILRLNGRLIVYENGTQTFSGDILEIGGNILYKRGTGTLILSGTVVVDIRVEDGTLVINGSADDSINALTGGTLMGTGVATGNVSIQDGYFRPGNSIGTFNVAPALTLNATSTLGIEVSGTAGDRVNVTGTVNLGGSALDVTGTPTIGSVFTIINNDLADAVVGQLWSGGAALNEGDTFTSDGQDYRVSYIGGDGNDVTLTALTGTPPSSGGSDPEPEPEPSGPDAPKVTQGSGPSPAGSLDGIALSWTKVDGATYYLVYRADCPTCPRKKIGGAEENSFIDNTAPSGQPFYYWLRSGNSDGLGGYSNWMAAWRYEQNPGRAGDFNGDGIMDLLWWNPENNQLSIWYLNGGMVQSASGPGDGPDIAEWLLIATGDFNSDGACDLLWWKPETGETRVWYLDKAKAVASGAGQWLVGSVVDLDAITGHAAIAYPGDVNGDGRSDILWRDYSSGEVTLWLMGSDGKPQLSGPPTPASEDITKGARPSLSGTLQWQVVGLSDADGNGKADVIWKDARNNNLATWVMDGSNISLAIDETKGLDTVWRAVGVGDLNMDSQADLVWRNESSGAVQTWLMQAGLFSEERLIMEGSEEATQWQVKAVGDFCSPGCQDVYCKHSESSAARIVTLSGEEFTPTIE